MYSRLQLSDQHRTLYSTGVYSHTLKGTLHHSALTVLPSQCNVARSLRSGSSESFKLLVITTLTRRVFGKVVPVRDCPQVKASGCDMRIESSEAALTGCTKSSHCVMAVYFCCKWLPSVGCCAVSRWIIVYPKLQCAGHLLTWGKRILEKRVHKKHNITNTHLYHLLLHNTLHTKINLLVYVIIL